MSILNVNQLQPVGGGNTITVGSSNIDYSGSITGNISVDGNLTVTGVVSNEDVTNIDSVGVVTARSGLHVTGGNFGIGTNSPVKILHASGSGTQAIRLENTAGTGNAILELKLPSSTFTTGLNPTSIYYDDTAGKEYVWYQNGTERLRISSDGRIGVGMVPHTSSTGYALQIDGGASSFIQIFNDTSGNTVNDGLVIGNDANTAYLVNKENTPLVFRTNNTERLRITSAGVVKVGSSTLVTPSTDADNFVIDTGDVDAGISILSATTGRIYFGDAGSNDQGSIRYVHTDDSMRFETNSSEKLRILSIGHLTTQGNNQGNPVGMELRNNNTNAYSHAELSLTSQNTTTSKIWCDVPNAGMRLNYNGGTSVKIDQSGNLVMSNGSGIDFSADPDASGRESELLDDYEHGTFTPTIKVEASGSNAAIDNVSGTYVKVGKLVYVGFHAELNGVPSGRSSSAAIEFYGMPFTSLAEGSSGLEEHIGSVRCHPVDNGTSLGACSEFILRLFDNNTYGRIEVRRSNGDLANASLYMRDNMQISAAITYRTAS